MFSSLASLATASSLNRLLHRTIGKHHACSYGRAFADKIESSCRNGPAAPTRMGSRRGLLYERRLPSCGLISKIGQRLGEGRNKKRFPPTQLRKKEKQNEETRNVFPLHNCYPHFWEVELHAAVNNIATDRDEGKMQTLQTLVGSRTFRC